MTTNSKPEMSQRDPKRRKCLMCRTTFRSLWAGERICKHCRGSRAWRNGETYSADPQQIADSARAR